MNNKKPIISFDSECWIELKNLFGLKNLKCKYCNKRITKLNIGGFASPKQVFCRNLVCLFDFINERRNLKEVRK